MLSEEQIKEVRDFVTDYLNGSEFEFQEDIIDDMVKYITEKCYNTFFRMHKWVEIQYQDLCSDFDDDENIPFIEDEAINDDEKEEMNDALVRCCVDFWFKKLKENI